MCKKTRTVVIEVSESGGMDALRVANLEIRVDSSNQTTNENGEATFKLKEGRHTLYVSSEDFEPVTRMFRVKKNGRMAVSLVRKQFPVELQITDSKHQPVPNPVLHYVSGAGTVNGDSAGLIKFNAPKADIPVRIEAQGMNPLETSLAISGPTTLKLVMSKIIVARKGRVRLTRGAATDDDGMFNALGVSLFWGPWAYKFDRAKLDRNLNALQAAGFDYLRVFGQVGCPGNDPQGSSGPLCPDGHRNYWHGRVISHKWPDYDQVIAEFTDYVYDKYGMRTEWTIFASADQLSKAEHFRLLDKFIAMSRGREHKIMHFEIGNEIWQTGLPFYEQEWLDHTRALTRYLNDRTDIPVAISDPSHSPDYCAAAEPLYAGGIADIVTIHFPRDYLEDGWRPIRQPWESCGYTAVSNNEPIGPGASVAQEKDPLKLVAMAVNSFITSVGFYVYHTGAGVWGGLYTDEGGQSPPGTDKSDVDEYSQTTIFSVIRKYLPNDVASWTKTRLGLSSFPIDIPSGETTHGSYIRAYGSVSGNRFVAMPYSLRSAVIVAKRSMDFEVINLLTGEVMSTHSLNGGERITISNGQPAYLIKGQYR